MTQDAGRFGKSKGSACATKVKAVVRLNSSGLAGVQEGGGSDPFATMATTGWKKVYRDRLRTEFVPCNDRKWNNYRVQVDKKLGADPDSAWEKYCGRCAFYGLQPQPWIIEVVGTLNGTMDGTYVEFGVENFHIKFQRLNDDDGFPDEISWHDGEWRILQLIPHVSGSADYQLPKRIVKEVVQADLQSGLPPAGTGSAKNPWTHTTSIEITGGPRFELAEGSILCSHATFDPCNGVYQAQEDGTYQGQRGWSLVNDGSNWKFMNDGVYYYQANSPDGPFAIDKNTNYSGREKLGKGEWQQFILAHNDESKASFPVVSGF